MTFLAVMFFLFLGFVIVPIIALKLLFHLVFGLVMLPVKLAAGALSLTGKVFAVVLKLVLGVFGLFFGLVLLPLLPFAILAGLAYLVASSLRPHAIAVRP